MFDHEPSEQKLNPELEAIERQLARLTPAAPRVDRDRLMYEAGIAAAAQPRGLGYIAEPSGLGARRWLWPAATALMTAASLLLATMLVWQHRSYALALQSQAESQRLAAAKLPETTVVPAIATGTVPNGPGTITNTGRSSFLQPKPGYLGIRYIALTHGVSAIETLGRTADSQRSSTPENEPTQRDLLRELLPANRANNPRS